MKKVRKKPSASFLQLPKSSSGRETPDLKTVSRGRADISGYVRRKTKSGINRKLPKQSGTSYLGDSGEWA